MEKRKALGRGLEALIPSVATAELEAEPSLAPGAEAIIYLEADKIKTGKYQPRTLFKEEKLNELIQSIKEKGIVQPVLVKKREGVYELIAGERRLRAAQSLGIAKIPAIVKNVGDSDAMELALVENIQREDLNPVEEARAYERLAREFGFTQEKIAQAVGRDRASVANTLRLLNLPVKIQKLILDDIITMGHARALLGIADITRMTKICEKVVRKGLSVRETEQLVQPHIKRRASVYRNIDPDIAAVEEDLQRTLGTKVRISHGKKRGRLVIEYFSPQDLERIINILKK